MGILETIRGAFGSGHPTIQPASDVPAGHYRTLGNVSGNSAPIPYTHYLLTDPNVVIVERNPSLLKIMCKSPAVIPGLVDLSGHRSSDTLSVQPGEYEFMAVGDGLYHLVSSVPLRNAQLIGSIACAADETVSLGRLSSWSIDGTRHFAIPRNHYDARINHRASENTIVESGVVFLGNPGVHYKDHLVVGVVAYDQSVIGIPFMVPQGVTLALNHSTIGRGKMFEVILDQQREIQGMVFSRGTKIKIENNRISNIQLGEAQSFEGHDFSAGALLRLEYDADGRLTGFYQQIVTARESNVDVISLVLAHTAN